MIILNNPKISAFLVLCNTWYYFKVGIFYDQEDRTGLKYSMDALSRVRQGLKLNFPGKDKRSEIGVNGAESDKIGLNRPPALFFQPDLTQPLVEILSGGSIGIDFRMPGIDTGGETGQAHAAFRMQEKGDRKTRRAP